VREALASALDARGLLDGACVLDLFAGTGALAFEALSRGAAHAVLVDRDPAMVRAMRESAATLGLQAQSEVLALDLERPASAWLPRLPGGPFELVFVDPPYVRVDLVAPMLEALAAADRLASEATVVIEHARRAPPDLARGFGEIAAYRYGDTAVVLWAAPSAADAQAERPRGSP
jgi:16S rRNA (guanine966-N2)-methyltransferase